MAMLHLSVQNWGETGGYFRLVEENIEVQHTVIRNSDNA